MKNYIDIEQIYQNGAYKAVVVKNNIEIVVSGTTVYTLPIECYTEEPYHHLQQVYNISFFYDENISIPFYCVPLIDFFAETPSGYFGTLHGFTDLGQIDSPIYYIGKNREVHFVAKNLQTFFENGNFLSRAEPRDSILLFNSLGHAKKALPFISIAL
ncbi:MAG: hypothetical protein K1V97_03830 [Lachnospiraceae bacterium]